MSWLSVPVSGQMIKLGAMRPSTRTSDLARAISHSLSGFGLLVALGPGAALFAQTILEQPVLAGAAAPVPSQGGASLHLSSRREGAFPYLPNAAYVITIRVPEEASREGWRCCWIEAYSKETAKLLSAQYRKTVIGNDPDMIFDAARTEASIRQIAPGIYEGYLALGGTRIARNYAARLYIHLYRLVGPVDGLDVAQGEMLFAARTHDRVARNFLNEPVLNVRFMYQPRNGWDNENGTRYGQPDLTGSPPSQLPNYAPPSQLHDQRLPR